MWKRPGWLRTSQEDVERIRQLRQRSTRKRIARRSWQLGILRRKRPNVHTYKIQILCETKDADRYTGAEFAHFMLNAIDDNLLLQVILTDEAAFHTLWIVTWTGTMVESGDRCEMRDRFIGPYFLAENTMTAFTWICYNCLSFNKFAEFNKRKMVKFCVNKTDQSCLERQIFYSVVWKMRTNVVAPTETRLISNGFFFVIYKKHLSGGNSKFMSSSKEN